MPEPASRTRIAIVGAGFIGRKHVEFIRQVPELELLGAADPTPASLAWLREHGIPGFSDYKTMLDELRPAGVVVATPNQLHEPVAVECLERTIPVLIEKPIADSVAAALRICAAAERTGTPVLVGHHRRHNPLIRAAREFIVSGALGRLVAVSAVDLRRKPDPYYEQAWRREPGGGPLLINGIHDIDCLRHLVGEVESVMAVTGRHARGYPVEDTAAVTFVFANGVLGTLAISDAVQAPWAWEIASGEERGYPHEREDTYLLCGTHGSLAVPTLTHWRNERGGGRADPFVRKQLFYEPSDPWVEEVRHFAAVIRGAAQPMITAQDGTRTLATTLAIGRSAEAGRPVRVDDLYQ